MSARLAAMVAPMPGESTLNTGRGRRGKSVLYRLPSLWAASKRRRSWLTMMVPGAPDMASLQQVPVKSTATSQLPHSSVSRPTTRELSETFCICRAGYDVASASDNRHSSGSC